MTPSIVEVRNVYVEVAKNVREEISDEVARWKVSCVVILISFVKITISL